MSNIGKKRLKTRIQYYANSDSTFQLELCGDIECNPGPNNTDDNGSANQHSITTNGTKRISYSKSDLITLNKYNNLTAPHLPCELWNPLTVLGIANRCRIPRKNRGGRGKFRLTQNCTRRKTSINNSLPSESSAPTFDSNNKSLKYNSKNLTIATWNVRSACNKSGEVADYIAKNNIDMCNRIMAS